MAWSVTTKGIEPVIERIGGLNRRTRSVLSQSVNTVTRRARTKGAQLIRDRVAFPAAYLAPRGARFKISRFAQPESLEARITARFRATSLARFARNPRARRGRGVAVQVTPGRLLFLRRAFVIPLRRGRRLTDTQRNLGLAIRLRKGETLSNKIQQVQTRSGLTLLYGPSVQQAFLNREGTGVADELAEPTARDLEHEFLRRLKI